MPLRDLSVLSLPSWVVVLVLFGLIAVSQPVLGLVFFTLWTRLVISDLHPALPFGFFESEEEAVHVHAWGFAFSAAFAVAQALGQGVVEAWAGPGGATGLWLLLALPGLALDVLVVRHITSAVDTLSCRRLERAGLGRSTVLLFLGPIYVAWTHHRARRALRALADDRLSRSTPRGRAG